MPILLHINTTANSGSHGRIGEEIGQLALSKGWDSYFAYGRNEMPSKSKLLKIGNNVDIKIHGLKTRLFDRHGFGSKKATIKLVEQIKEIKPDIIHLHNIHGYYINIEILFNYLATTTIPIVWTLHDCWSFTGHCSYFDFVECNKWKTGCYSCPQKKEYPASIFIDNSKKNYLNKFSLFTSVKNLTIVPVSNWLGNLVKDSFLNKYPLQLIYNGVNLASFSPQINQSIKTKLGVGNRLMLLGVASIWEKRKGLDDFISLNKIINPDCVIVLIGLNQKQLKKIPSNIIGISRTEDIQELAEIYSTADLFLNLTYEDNFPTTNLEALACGTPVLTYKTGGSIEAVTPDTGFVVEKGDLNAVLAAIDIIKTKGKSTYTSASRERAVNFYNKDDRYMEYLKLYETLISNKGNS